MSKAWQERVRDRLKTLRRCARYLVSPHGRKVDFLVAGTQKGGTTVLDANLRTHPDLCMCARKEAHWFDSDRHFRGSRIPYYLYHSTFRPTPAHRLLGEATPRYMYWYDVPRRVWNYNPAMKFIVLLRNPAERAYSHWNMEKQRGFETRTFGEAIRHEGEMGRASATIQDPRFSYVDRGFYSEQLRRIWRFFPREQVLVLRSEDLRNSTQATMDRVYAFLGIPSRPVEIASRHAREYGSPMAVEDREHLRRVYEFEIRDLERLLGWDCGEWLA